MSVIVPVYNCRDWLARALRSALDQSLPPTAVEVIAVNDGSTDGSAEELDRLARAHANLTVIHQPNSGGPGAPRNAGLDRASGEYVFFLDADDHLAPQALERLCAMADEHRTDIVIGKYVGVGRRVPRFTRTVPRTDVLAADPFVYGTLSPLKLFRRALIDRLDLRFEAGLASHEDQIFTARAYFGADGISVLADHDCYYWVDREDGTSALQTGGARAEAYFPAITRVMRFVADNTTPGPARDRLMARHFRYEVFSRLGHPYPAMSPDEKAATRAGARALFDAWFTPGVAAEFGPRGKLLAHCVQHDLVDLLEEIVPFGLDGSQIPITVRGDRAYALYPGFDGPVPASCYEITKPLPLQARLTDLHWSPNGLRVHAQATIPGLPQGQQTATLVLHTPHAEHRVPLHPADTDTGNGVADPVLTADLDITAIPSPGDWSVDVAVRAERIEVRRPLTAGPEPQLPGSRVAPVENGAPYLTPHFTKRGTLALHAGGTADAPAPPITVASLEWVSRRTLAVHATLPAAHAEAATWTAEAELTHRETGQTTAVPLKVEARPEELHLAAELDFHNASPGRWDISLRLSAGHDTITRRLPAPQQLPPPKLTGGTRLEPYRTVHGNLTVTATQVPRKTRLRSLLHRRT
ncbi:glycosyltransferase family 2 protein [Spirillospora sp. NPDC127200]